MAVDGDELVIPCDTVVLAIGTRANPVLTASCPDLALTLPATSLPMSEA
jgi:NADH dehydrogenase FAD-containing subunit